MPYSIFLADDHTLIRNGLKRIIEEKGNYRIIGETGDGLEIITGVKKLQPDIVILDISMPRLRGIEAIRKIRRFNKKVKILILTMHKNEEYVYESLTCGAQGYLLKEDADKELMTALETLKNNKLYVSPTFSSDVIKMLVQRKQKPAKRTKKTPYTTLTPREREVLKLITEGDSNKKAASKLGISVRTVEHHRLSIMRKLNAHNTAALVRLAIQNKLVQ
ncbi:MAG TPA: response regulator transcription factor [candidate division WOR-3 bacterium]|uniref:Response regulator transcription factor n=1 Tax=candidate division WOR-3 bacterium TaxID=2052148 RepID=A0A9C9K093_UNCW3|nr:response regulator transcription factor [candidate division WOR-3 bacterium]